MKLVYCSCVCSEETYKKLFSTSRVMPGQQVQKYNRTMLMGLSEQEGVDVVAISKLPISLENTKKKIVNIPGELLGKANVIYLPHFNIPKIGNLMQLFFSAYEILKIKKEESPVVILDVLNISMGLGVVLACKLKKIPLVGIVTDLPEYLVENHKSAFVRQCKKIIDACDGYVLLTELMNDIINPMREKPYVVIEGQVDAAMGKKENLLQNKYEKKVCLYAGNLDICNGIKYLLEGFITANICDAELHIYGGGNYVSELQELIKEKSNIKFFGTRLNEEVVEAQTKATLLINPRPTDQEFTKYSFPSKNMEYMASGTPMLTTKLPGMPKEYYPYVYIIEDESKEGIKEKLEEVLCETAEALYDKGNAAKRFVLENKTGNLQARKIIPMLQEIIKSQGMSL